MRSSSAACLNSLTLCHRHRRQSAGVGGVKTDEDFVRGVLQPGGRLVQFPGSFTCQLAQLVAIGHMRKCPKNQIRTHDKNSPSNKLLPFGTTWHRWCSWQLNVMLGLPPQPRFLALDAPNERGVLKLWRKIVKPGGGFCRYRNQDCRTRTSRTL